VTDVELSETDLIKDIRHRFVFKAATRRDAVTSRRRAALLPRLSDEMHEEVGRRRPGRGVRQSVYAVKSKGLLYLLVK